MSEHDNVRIVEKFFEATNAHNLFTNDELYAAEYRAISPGNPEPLTLEQNRANIKVFLDAFPNWEFKVSRMVAQGDYVVANWESTGTHTGPLKTPSGGSVPPTGKEVIMYGSTTYLFKDGQLVRSWAYWDRAALIGQLGLLPEM